MDDIEKAKLIYNLKQSPEASRSAIETLENSLSSDIQARLDTVLKSFRLEELFQNVYSALPWVHLIHGLEEKQYPAKSKKVFQVPDSLVLLKNAKLRYIPFLVDVKTVLGEKKTLKNIQIKQSVVLKEYSDVLKIPQLYGVYWEKLHMWTLNSLDQMDKKTSSFKLPIENAFVNDLSAVTGDVTYIFPKKYIRKAIATPSKNCISWLTKHEKYGAITKQWISLDGNTFTEITEAESAIIDSTTKMKEVSNQLDDDFYTIIEEAEHPIAMKLSTLILRLLARLNTEPTAENCLKASELIQNFYIRLNSLRSTMIPRDRTQASDLMFGRTFYSSSTFKTYLKFHEVGLWDRMKIRINKGDFYNIE